MRDLFCRRVVAAIVRPAHGACEDADRKRSARSEADPTDVEKPIDQEVAFDILDERAV